MTEWVWYCQPQVSAASKMGAYTMLHLLLAKLGGAFEQSFTAGASIDRLRGECQRDRAEEGPEISIAACSVLWTVWIESEYLK